MEMARRSSNENNSFLGDGPAVRGRPWRVMELTAELLGTIAEPNRIALLAVLNECGEASVQELADQLAAPHQKVSRHLNVLYGAGMVSRRRGERSTVLYALIDWSGWWVIEQIARSVQAGLADEAADLASQGAGSLARPS
jgi:DNA-binding transcriptional ArsR family regulator